MSAVARPRTQLHLPKLHPAQLEVGRHPARFRVVACGRRWGKTWLGAILALKALCDGQFVWWVAPSYRLAQIGWRLLRYFARSVELECHEAEHRIREPRAGGTLEVRSADRPELLRGEGLDFLVLDECAFVRETVWVESLRPALADRRGRALFISTPCGHNWFWQLYTRGLGDDLDWRSWRYPTATNPHIPRDELEAARREMPERVYQQEFEAEFLPDGGAVFRNFRQLATAAAQDAALAGHTYVIGVDWGKHVDYTVFAVLDLSTQEIVYLDRSHLVDYTLQVARLRALCERFRPQAVVVERNAMGEPLIEQLQRDGLPIVPFLTTAASKAALIDALALAFERGVLRLLHHPILLAELESFTVERLPSGTLRYTAPEGAHDDCVMAIALAWHAASSGTRIGVLPPLLRATPRLRALGARRRGETPWRDPRGEERVHN